MNAHQHREAKAARRRKRTSGPSRGNVRGPVTRAMGRAELERIGRERYLAMSAAITGQLEERGVRVRAQGASRRHPLFSLPEALDRVAAAVLRR